MVKSYMELLGIFKGKQATYNIQILDLLYDDGPLTAWEIAGKLCAKGTRISLHATLNKRLRSLENKGYVKRAEKKWCLRFKGIIAALLIQKKPRPLGIKWTELVENYANVIDDHFQGLSKVTIQGNGITLHPLEMIKKTGHSLRTFDDWVTLSTYVKRLIQTGVINFDVISNETLFGMILTEASHEQIEDLMKDWNFKTPT